MALDITLGNPNPQTGAFNFVRGSDGDVQFDETGAHGVVTSVIEVKASYPFDRSHGTDLMLARSLTSRTPSQVEAEALESVKPMEDADEIQQASAVAVGDTRLGRLALDMSWKDGAGEIQSKRVEV